MFVLGNLLMAVAQILTFVLQIYTWILIGRAICSWVQANPRNPIVQFLYMTTEPPLRAIRRILPSNLRYFPLDIAFLVLFGLVFSAQYWLVQNLIDLATRLR